MYWQLQFFWSFIIVLQACNFNLNSGNTSEKGLFDKPLKTIMLPAKLAEISGITFYKDGYLLGHHDENASIYLINYEGGNAEKLVDPGINGDFEDIAFTGDKTYLLQSNGTIYEFDMQDTVSNKPQIYKTNLNEKNDTEGLAYDKYNNKLLIACKNKPGIKKTEVGLNVRCIYQFDLLSKKLIEKPLVTIDLDKLSKQYGIAKFMPSAIAIHPQNGHIYILASVGKALIVMDRDNEIVETYKLKPSIFQQPEGLCFHPDGHQLFISNEGSSSNANLLVFKMD
jgi:uncharacterized protein YjiK